MTSYGIVTSRSCKCRHRVIRRIAMDPKRGDRRGQGYVLKETHVLAVTAYCISAAFFLCNKTPVTLSATSITPV